MGVTYQTIVDRTVAEQLHSLARGGDDDAAKALETLSGSRDVTDRFDRRGAVSVSRSSYDSPHGKGRVEVVEIVFAAGADGFENHVGLYTDGRPSDSAIQRRIDQIACQPAW